MNIRDEHQSQNNRNCRASKSEPLMVLFSESRNDESSATRDDHRLAHTPALELPCSSVTVPEVYRISVLKAATLFVDALTGVSTSPNQTVLYVVGPGLVSRRAGLAVPEVDGVTVGPVARLLVPAHI